MKRLKKVFLLMLVFISFVSTAQEMSTSMSSLPTDPKTKKQIRYFYFPNLEAYFDNLNVVYYFKVNGEWQTAEELPANYGGYSLYNKVKVMITDFDGDEPYQLLAVHKKKYPYNAKGRFKNDTASEE